MSRSPASNLRKFIGGSIAVVALGLAPVVHSQTPPPASPRPTAASTTAPTLPRATAASGPVDAGGPAADASAPVQTRTSSATARLNAAGNPILEGLSQAEFALLRPLAMRGAAILVRDPDAGARSRITIVVPVRAPLATVRSVITTPEHYPTFMPVVSSVDIISRRQNQLAFRFHVSAVIFDVSTLSALHVVNDRRIDVAIVSSDIGPGASRWDLLADGDGTLLALSTWGDPSQGNWWLRQVAARSPSAIAAMNISTDILLTLGAARRAEILAGRNLPVRPAARSAPAGPLEPPPPGTWTSLARASFAVGSIALDGAGAMTQSTMAVFTPASPEVVLARLEDVAHYPSHWGSMHDVRVVADVGGVRRFRSIVDNPLIQTTGEEERSIERTASGTTVRWHGVAGDYVGYDHRWDLVPGPNGGTIVMLTGGDEYNRAGFITRSMVERDVWLQPGFATSWKLVWMRPMLAAP